jgi:3-polyprenyl-4-hydroxybenzoate decarboxylase
VGAIVMPPVMTFYNHPRSIEDMTRHIVGKILDVFDLEIGGFERWAPKEDGEKSL